MNLVKLIPFIVWIVCIYGKIPCDPDSFRFVEAPNPINPSRAYVFRIANNEEIGCAINASYLWEILNVHFDGLIPINLPILKNRRITKEKSNKVNFKSMMATSDIYGHTFALKVTLIPRPTHYRSYRLHYINISLEDYNFHIVGGEKRQHNLGEGSLWLNATAKRESGRPFNVTEAQWICTPPFRRNTTSKKLNWEILEIDIRPNKVHKCSVVVILNEGRQLSASQEITIKPMMYRPLLEVVCVENCHNANAYRETVLAYVCHANCFGKPAWTTEPYDELIQSKLNYSGPQPNQLLIPAGTFAHGTSYNILTVLGEATANYTVTYAIPEVAFEIKCIKNCYKRHKEIVFKAICNGLCEGITYSWEAIAQPKSWNWTYINSDNHTDIFTFPPFTFPPKTGAKLATNLFAYNATHSFIVDDYHPSVTITCVSDSKVCSRPFADKEVKLTINCTKDCDVPGFFWQFQPPLVNFHKMALKNNTVVIPANSYKPSERVVATLFVDEVTEVTFFEVHYADSPVLKIFCMKNCKTVYKQSNPHRPLMLQVNCSGPCGNNMSYTWTLDPEMRQVDMDPDVLDGGRAIMIPGNSYDENTKVIAVATTADGVSANFTITYGTPNAIFLIFCIQNCFTPADPGVDTILEAECHNECDDVSFIWSIEPAQDPFFWHDKVALSFLNKSITLKKLANLPSKVNVIVTASNGKARSSYALAFREAKPALYLACFENCNNSWTHLPVKIKAGCIKDCVHLKYIWDFSPGEGYLNLNKYANLTDNDTMLVIFPHMFKDKDRVNFTVSARNGKATLLIIFEELTPVLTLKCQPNPCNQVQNNRQRVEVTVTCKKNCDNSSYAWNITPPISQATWDSKIIRGYRDNSLTFLPDIYSYNANITLTVSFKKAQVSTYILFWNPRPEFKIVCETNCDFSNPYLPVKLRAACDWFCEYITVFEWDLDLPENMTKGQFFDKVTFTPTRKTIVIQANVYKDGDIITVTTKAGSAIAIHKLSFVEPKPSLQIKCLRNCELDYAKETVFEVNCIADCSVPHGFQWNYTKGERRPLFYNLHQTIVIPEGSYLDINREVNLTVCKGKGCTTKIYKYEQTNSSIEVVCESNCIAGNTANPKLATKFRVYCLELCDRDMNYTWYLDQPPHSFNVKEDVAYGPNKETFTLRKGLYLNETCVQIKVVSGLIFSAITVCFIEPAPTLTITCQQNCGYPDPYFDLILQVLCIKNCEHLDYTWIITPTPRSFNWSESIHLHSNNNSITVYAGTFLDKEDILFIANYESVFTELLLHFTAQPPIIKLETNHSVEFFRPNDDVSVSVICKKNCDNPFYIWDVNPKNEDFIWSLNIEMKNKNHSMIIKSGTFKEENVVITVESNNSATAFLGIKYVLEPTELSISCDSNCRYDPEQDASFIITCQSHCEDFAENIFCALSPKVHANGVLQDLSQAKIYKFTISRSSYKPGENVTLMCKANDSMAKFIFTYNVLPWNGQCGIIPNEGVSGITEFKIECTQFHHNATYRVYQRIQGYKQGIGMKLIQGWNPYMDEIYLAPEEGRKTLIIVDICVGWDVKKTITFEISCEPMAQNNNGNFRSIESMNIFEDMFLMYKNLFRERNVQKALKIAFVIITNVHKLPFKKAIEMKENVLYIFLQNTKEFEPTQVLLFVEAVLIGNISSVASLETSMEIVSETMSTVSYWSQSFVEYNKRTLIFIGNLTLYLTGVILQQGRYVVAPHLYKAEQNDDDDDDYSTLYNDMHFINYRNLLRLMTVDAVHSIGFALDLFEDENRIIRIAGKVFNAVTMTMSPNNDQVLTLQAPDSKSYVLVNPAFSYKQVSAQDKVLLKFASTNQNIFWWHRELRSFDTDLIFFEVKDNYGIYLQTYTEVFINLIRSRQYDWWYGEIKEGQYNVLILYVPQNYTLELVLITVDAIANISVSFSKPNLSYTEEIGFAVKEKAIHYYFAEESPIYIGMYGSGYLYFYFTSLQCLTWLGYLKWTHTGCHVSKQQVDKNFIACTCYSEPEKHLAVYTANMVVPKFKIINGRQLDYEINDSDHMIEFSAVVVFTMAMILFYVAVVKDNNFKKRQRIYFLKDNDDADKEMYLIAVQTGIWYKSGTTSRVAIQVIGTIAASKVHLLNIDNDEVLTRNSLDFFVMYTSVSLGTITFLKLWHDSYGENPDWFCDTIVITHIASRQKYIFIVSRWFSMIKLPGSTIGSFEPHRYNQPIPFSARFESSIRYNHNFFGPWTDRRTAKSLRYNIITTTICLLCMMSICVLILRVLHNALFLSILMAVFAGTIVTILLDLLFRNTR